MSRGILLQETTTQANTKTSSSMYETSTVARAYSFALQSVHDTKDNVRMCKNSCCIYGSIYLYTRENLLLYDIYS
jgi:hypothetical protein